jgi:enoyl-CoA hydratase/carnithine racemase
LRDQLEAEREQFAANLQHDNAAEGLRAFFEKRRPKFS